MRVQMTQQTRQLWQHPWVQQTLKMVMRSCAIHDISVPRDKCVVKYDKNDAKLAGTPGGLHGQVARELSKNPYGEREICRLSDQVGVSVSPSRIETRLLESPGK